MNPKIFLSGDFFWCHEKDGYYYIAVSDCTGHGVPGALLSVLGQRFLNEAVEKENVTTPSAIIKLLESKVISAFKDQNSVEYGVELGLVCFNKQSNELVFSSNGINLFLYQNTGINCIKPKYTVSGSANLQPEDQTFKLNKGDCFYLSSDGFADQFGLQMVNQKSITCLLWLSF
ncbi:MAG: PP2C family protein-serine/threonine phosphatase [Sphingobacteriaceae bacterium]